jgi:hypothetical protein
MSKRKPEIDNEDILGSLLDAPVVVTAKRRKSRKAQTTPVERAPLLRTCDIDVVAVGTRLGLEGWTPSQVRDSIEPKIPTTVACWYDCHPFDWAPCRVPLAHDPRFNVYYSLGNFCSWSCAKAHCLLEKTARKGSVSLVALEANRSRRRLQGYEKCADNSVLVKALPRKECLQMFGGTVGIEDFRKGCIRYDGSVIGEEATLPSKSLNRKRHGMVPAAFIDESKVSVLRCVCMGGVLRPVDNASTMMSTSKQQQQQQQKQTPSVKTSVQERITTRANEVNLYEDRCTLMSAMGLKVSTDKK